MKKRKKLKLSKEEKIIVKLHNIVNFHLSNDVDKRAAKSLLSWHLKRQELSYKQWEYAKALVKKLTKLKKSQAARKQYLYAISDGEMVKLGMSHDIKKRLKALQTSNSKKLKVVWELYTKKTAGQTKLLESKLHKICKKYRVRGEWFLLDCLNTVKYFRG